MRKLIIFCAILVMLTVFTACSGAKKSTMSWTTPPPMTIDQSKEYTAAINTNYGEIVVQLLPKDAPLAVNSFVFLSREGFYTNVIFHRIVKGFVIQGGDPTGTGSGGPGYRFNDEKITREYEPGTLAMANSGANTNGSQFFITLADLRTRLAKNYTIFGKVTSGYEVVQKIGNVAVNGERPVKDVIIKSIKITEK